MEEDTHSLGKRTQRDEDVLRRGPPASDTPGGDCKSLCLRHQRMANGGTNLMLQKVRPHPFTVVELVLTGL